MGESIAVNIIEKHEVDEIRITFPNASATEQIWFKVCVLTSIKSKAQNQKKYAENPPRLQESDFIGFVLHSDVTNFHAN